jgi:hypothetical protein
VSRYLVDKFLYRVDRNESEHEAYSSDPRRFVSTWETTVGPEVTESETTSTHGFTTEERRALEEHDYITLYRLGANPFLLWTMMLPILQRREPDERKVAREYRDAIKPYGRPDNRT